MDKNIEIDSTLKEPWDCYVCGRHDVLVHKIYMRNLCQHMITLCPSCMRDFKKAIAEVK